MPNSECIEVIRADRRAVFVRSAEGWRPDWFYQRDRAMLRFKDHEWLSIGHVKPMAAAEAERLTDGGAVFRGTAHYGRSEVAWSVTVRPDALSDGFVVECAFTPAAAIELLEAYSTFETPYEYDGRETVTTVIGMNPVSRWEGPKRISPPIWANPAWVYSRPQAVRITAPCSAPYLCQAITAAGAIGDRYVTIVGDWNVCRVHDVYAAPTRDAPADPPSTYTHRAPLKGCKYVVGALNWSSAMAKDPNVLFAGGEAHRQRVIVDFADELPGGALDAMLLAGWQRAARVDVPRDGRVEAFDRAAARAVTWQSAVNWLRDVYASDEPTEGLYRPGEGICTYVEGTRPKAGGDYGWEWWTQWAGPLHYRARMTGDEPLEAVCRRNDEAFARHAGQIDYFAGGAIASKVSSLPSIWWANGPGRGGVLHEALRPMLEATARRSAEENGRTRALDSGAQASIAEALLLGGQAYDDPAMTRQGHVLLEELAAKLDGSFWEFNVGPAGSLMHGGQIRSLGHGHAILANLIAWRQDGQAIHLTRARRFARYLLAVNYATHNGSHDPDFDWRGWCNGSNAGRDQIAEFPPWETQNGLLCIAALMGEAELEDGFYDALWYIARTGLAQFPAARTVKRVLDESMHPHYVPRDSIASERDIYDALPYLAYENPHDQTLLASYQGSDCILGEFVYGCGLASSSDDRLGVLVPRAATMDLAELAQRHVHVWNPTGDPIEATITAAWTDRSTTSQPVTVPPRQALRLVLKKDERVFASQK